VPSPASTAYKGHADDRDMATLVAAWPELAGTRLDDCRSCHRGGALPSEGRFRNSCDWCHLLVQPDPGWDGPVPASWQGTLNPFGLAYLQAGRDQAALCSLAGLDSDGDGHADGAELAAGSFPGEAGSRPGVAPLPARVFGLAELAALGASEQWLLVNDHTGAVDAYARYEGLELEKLLPALGLDPADPGLQGATLRAPDGYRKDVPAAWWRLEAPTARFHAGLDEGALGAGCGVARYPADVPWQDGQRLPAVRVALAWARDGQPLEPAKTEPVSGKLAGEGPIRLVVPQWRPGPPDRGQSVSPTSCGDGRDFDAEADHNAGHMVRGVVALRLEPAPVGTPPLELADSWDLVERGELVVYGYGVGGEGTR